MIIAEGKGSVSHKQAVEKAEKERNISCQRNAIAESDVDHAVKLFQQQYEKGRKSDTIGVDWRRNIYDKKKNCILHLLVVFLLSV